MMHDVEATAATCDLGARVIKVERPRGGDFARGYDGAVNGLPAYFAWLNRSRESLTLDLAGELAAHPALSERCTTVDSPVGPIDALPPPLRVQGVTPRMDAIPAAGEHTAAILAELGLDAPERAAP